MASKKRVCCCVGNCAFMEMIVIGYENFYFQSVTADGFTLTQEQVTNDFDPFGYPAFGLALRPISCELTDEAYDYPNGFDALPEIYPSRCNDGLNIFWRQYFKCQATTYSQGNAAFHANTQSSFSPTNAPMYEASQIIWTDETGAQHVSYGFFFQWKLDELRGCDNNPDLHGAQRCAFDDCTPGSRPERGSFNGLRGNLIERGTVHVALLWDTPPVPIYNGNNPADPALWPQPDRALFIGTTQVSQCGETWVDSNGITYTYLTRPQSHSRIITSFSDEGSPIPGFSSTWRAIDTRRVTFRQNFGAGWEEHVTNYDASIYFYLGAYVPS